MSLSLILFSLKSKCPTSSPSIPPPENHLISLQVLSLILTEGILVSGAAHRTIRCDLQEKMCLFISRVEVAKADLPIKLEEGIGIVQGESRSHGGQNGPEKQTNEKIGAPVVLERGIIGHHGVSRPSPSHGK